MSPPMLSVMASPLALKLSTSMDFNKLLLGYSRWWYFQYLVSFQMIMGENLFFLSLYLQQLYLLLYLPLTSQGASCMLTMFFGQFLIL
nr:Organelle RRM domain-containing protein 1, chloroplastic [Ipomoea batatas]GMD54489.1 Organelle RRM domain-containing protein 1, chloroplastic [Ipomoea batatas]GMD57292.1 Organelle RRM domain-containing protein 1, chloroplastic [Ipomoea batatas]